jgi:hypothetical protein
MRIITSSTGNLFRKRLRKRLHVDEVMILIRAGKGYMSMRL